MRLFLEDCLEIMPSIPDGSVDLVLCDLPYGTTQNKWDCPIPLDRLWAEYHRVAKHNAAFVMTAAQPFSSKLGASNIKELRYSWTWVKPHTGQLKAKRMPLKNVEDVLVFYRKQPTFNPQFTTDEPYEAKSFKRGGYVAQESYGKQRTHVTVSDGRRYPKQVLKFAERGAEHPTKKPLALMEYLIRTYSDEGQVVLDNTMGSGTTGVAAFNTGREFIGIEMNAEYFKIAERRIKEAS